MDLKTLLKHYDQGDITADELILSTVRANLDVTGLPPALRERAGECQTAWDTGGMICLGGEVSTQQGDRITVLEERLAALEETVEKLKNRRVGKPAMLQRF